MSPQDKDEANHVKLVEKAKSGRLYYVNKIKDLQETIIKDHDALTIQTLNDEMFLLQRYIKGYDEKSIELTNLGIDLAKVEDNEIDDARNEAVVSTILHRLSVLETEAKTVQQKPVVTMQAPQPKQEAHVLNDTWGQFNGSQANWTKFQSSSNYI